MAAAEGQERSTRERSAVSWTGTRSRPEAVRRGGAEENARTLMAGNEQVDWPGSQAAEPSGSRLDSFADACDQAVC